MCHIQTDVSLFFVAFSYTCNVAFSTWQVAFILSHAFFIIQSEFTFGLHSSVLKTPVVGTAKG